MTTANQCAAAYISLVVDAHHLRATGHKVQIKVVSAEGAAHVVVRTTTHRIVSSYRSSTWRSPDYLNVNPKFPRTIQKWKGKNDFQTNKAKVRSLMEAKFIPYTDAPPAVFVNAVNDSHDVFKPTNDGQE